MIVAGSGNNEVGTGPWDVYPNLAQIGDMVDRSSAPSPHRSGRQGRSNLKSMARAPQALRNLSVNVVQDMDLRMEVVREIREAPPSRVLVRGRGPARGRMTRKQMPTTGMQGDGHPNACESPTHCPQTLIEVSTGIRVDFMAQKDNSRSTAPNNVILDTDPQDCFITPSGIRRTIQPTKIPPRLIRARQRRLLLPTAEAEDNPQDVEDITVVDCPTTHVHDTVDSVSTPPMHGGTDGLPCVPGLGRWYTESPPTCGGGDGVPWCQTTPKNVGFSEAKKGRHVLTSQKHIGIQSADSNTMYALLYGTVFMEYTDVETNTHMFVVDYGHPWMRYHIPRCLCDLRPLEAQGNPGAGERTIVGERDPWRGRLQLDFGEASHAADNVVDGGSDTVLIGALTLCNVERRGPTHQFPLPLPVRGAMERQIQGYSEDSLATCTDESTAKEPFPKVTISYPSYLLFDHTVREAPDSSCEEWIAGEEDWATSDDCLEDHEEASCANEQAVDNCIGIGKTDTDDCEYEEWSQSSQSSQAMPLRDEEFEKYYHQSNWTSEHITLLGDRNNITGPRPGCRAPLQKDARNTKGTRGTPE
jgi:hypothetical protein